MAVHVRKPSWKDRLTSVSKKFGVGTSPSAVSASPPKQSCEREEKERENSKRETERERAGAKRELVSQPNLDDEWCVLNVKQGRVTVETVTAVASHERALEEADDYVLTNREEDDMEHTDGLFDRLRGAKKGDKVDGSKNSIPANRAASPGLGGRKTSVGSRLKPDGGRLARPGSPQPLQRRSSGRGRPKLDVYDHVNGQASPRSTSPSRTSSFTGRRKTSSNNQPARTDSPSHGDRRHDHLKQGHQNGKNGRSSPANLSSATGESAFSKVRDTLKISKAKKKLRKKKGSSAYSVAPVEINFPPESMTKYQDPFEAQASFTDSTEVVPHTQSHDFKPVSIPHNKPEYCDHCGETAWGLYRQVLKCCKCDFIVHRKCESKVIIDCSSRLEQAVLQHDKQVEDHATAEEDNEKEKEELEVSPRVPVATEHPSDSATATPPSTPSSHHHTSSPQVLSEKAKLAKKIREYNRKTTPVNHIHLKSAHGQREAVLDYQGFVRVHMCVQRPIHVSTAITRTSWYRLMRPVKERSEDAGLETAFYLPTDTNRLVHINNTTTTKELVQILLKKFCVTDNPKKFSLYEEYGGDCRRLFEEDNPLEIALEASVSNRNSKLILRDNTYSTIQWDAFTPPELNNFILILRREEELYVNKLQERFKLWQGCISHAMKEKCKEEISMQTYLGNGANPPPPSPSSSSSSLLGSRTKA